MNPKTRKTEIRRRIVERILAMPPAERSHQELALIRRFEDLPGLEHASTVLLYVSVFPEEFETRPILRQILESGRRLILPRVDRPSRTLHLFEVCDLVGELVPGHRGIPEPSSDCSRIDSGSIDWVLVPGLAFSSTCYRLGRGAGHYDRLLPTLRAEVPRWALILDSQWSDDFPIEPHDQPLDGVADAFREVRRDRQSIDALGGTE